VFVQSGLAASGLPATCSILAMRVPAMKLGSQFSSTTRWVRSPAAWSEWIRTALPESPKMTSPSQP